MRSLKPGAYTFSGFLKETAPLRSRFGSGRIDFTSVTEPVDNEILQLGLEHQLNSYDAAYLELAQRRKLPLATEDNNLILAARAKAVLLL